MAVQRSLGNGKGEEILKVALLHRSLKASSVFFRNQINMNYISSVSYLLVTSTAQLRISG